MISQPAEHGDLDGSSKRLSRQCEPQPRAAWAGSGSMHTRLPGHRFIVGNRGSAELNGACRAPGIAFASCRYCFGLFVLFLLSVSTARGLDIVAHRGASHAAPENTVAAFRLAWQQHADGIEGDYYLTSDGHIVCFHDHTAGRIAGVDRLISSMTFAEVRALDVGRWKGPQWVGQRAPTLREVLATVPAGKFALIEIKCGPEIVPELCQELAAAHLAPKQTRVIAFDKRVIAAVKRKLPSIKAYWLVGYQRDKRTGQWTPNRREVLAALRQIGADGLDSQGNREVVDRSFVQALRAAGMEVHVWTIDDVPDARYFQQLGVDSITTNRPALMRAKLAKPTAAPQTRTDRPRPRATSRQPAPASSAGMTTVPPHR